MVLPLFSLIPKELLRDVKTSDNLFEWDWNQLVSNSMLAVHE